MIATATCALQNQEIEDSLEENMFLSGAVAVYLLPFATGKMLITIV